VDGQPEIIMRLLTVSDGDGMKSDLKSTDLPSIAKLLHVQGGSLGWCKYIAHSVNAVHFVRPTLNCDAPNHMWAVKICGYQTGVDPTWPSALE